MESSFAFSLAALVGGLGYSKVSLHSACPSKVVAQNRVWFEFSLVIAVPSVAVTGYIGPYHLDFVQSSSVAIMVRIIIKGGVWKVRYLPVQQCSTKPY